MGDFAEVPSKKKLKAAFYEYSDGSETLTPEQFKSLCYKFYLSPTNKGISDLFKVLDKNSDSLLTFEEVHSLIDKQWTPINDRKQTFLQDLKNCRKKTGPINREELKEILQQGSDEALTDEDIDFCFEKMDLNGDAEISEEEIAELIFQFDEVLSRAPSRVEKKRHGSGSKDRKRSRSRSGERKHSGSSSRERKRKDSGSKERKRSRSSSKDRKRTHSGSRERHRSGSGDRKRKGSGTRKGSGDSGRSDSGKGSGQDKNKDKMMNGDTYEDENIVDETFEQTIEKPLGTKQKKPEDDEEDEDENEDMVQDEEDNDLQDDDEESTEETEDMEESKEKEKSKKDKVKEDADKKKAKEITKETEDEDD